MTDSPKPKIQIVRSSRLAAKREPANEKPLVLAPPVYANPGAALDKDPLTALRLQLLSHGYIPIAGYDKTCRRFGWSRLKVDADLIRSWKGSRSLKWPTTNLRVERGLCVIDVDSTHAGLLGAFDEELELLVPKVAAEGLRRLGGAGGKVAIFCRIDPADTFWRIQSQRWVRPEDLDKDSDDREEHRVEIFGGGGGARQFGSFGAHSRDERGAILRYYTWLGRSPAEVPLSKLPLIARKDCFRLADAFEVRAVALGLVPVPETIKGETTPSFAYDLVPEMDFDGMSLDELEDTYQAARHKPEISTRISSAFLGYGQNPTKCHIGWSDFHGCVCIHNYEDGTTHLPAACAPPPDLETLFEQLRALQVLP